MPDGPGYDGPVFGRINETQIQKVSFATFRDTVGAGELFRAFGG